VFVKLFDSYKKIFDLLENKQPRKFILDGNHYGIVRVTDSIFVFKNECPHLNGSLTDGFINDFHEIVCPLHSYIFSLESGEEISQRCDALEVYNIKVKEDILYADLP